MKCSCENPGWCERHQMWKNRRRWELCQNEEKYRQHWDVTRAGACQHLGEQIDERICELCGRKGQVEPLRVCELHGECTVRKYKAGQPEPSCLSCLDHTQIIALQIRASAESSAANQPD